VTEFSYIDRVQYAQTDCRSWIDVLLTPGKVSSLPIVFLPMQFNVIRPIEVF